MTIESSAWPESARSALGSRAAASRIGELARLAVELDLSIDGWHIYRSPTGVLRGADLVGVHPELDELWTFEVRVGQVRGDKLAVGALARSSKTIAVVYPAGIAYVATDSWPDTTAIPLDELDERHVSRWAS